MNIDTSRTLRIENSLAKQLVLIGLGVLMTAVATAVAWLPGPPSDRKFLGGYVGIGFFGLCTVVMLWRLITSRGPVITISAEGIHDTRLSTALVPWTAITGISTWSAGRQKIMVLAIRPDMEPRLGLTRFARWTRSANRAFGTDGLFISASGLKIDYDTLLRASLSYAHAKQQATGVPQIDRSPH